MQQTVWAVDGSFFAQRISGIQRYSIELLAALDEMAPAGLVELVVPPQVKAPAYQNIKVVPFGTRQGLASYLFFVVESGSGTLEYEGETRVLSAGDCVFLDCRRPYRHYTGDDLWQLRWAHFYGPNMAAIYKKYRERGGQPSFHPENTAPYTRRLEALYTLAASDNYVRDMQICEGLFALLTLLMQESWHPEIVRTAGTKRQNVQEIKDYLDLHFAEKITLDALAERFYINKFYLTRVFKEQFGLSVTSYLTQLRITQAKRLLRFTDKSVENVAQECGLNDANYFSRLFKKVEGTTPGEYRRQW